MTEIPHATLDTLIAVAYGAAILIIGGLVTTILAWLAAIRRKLDANTDITQSVHDQIYEWRRKDLTFREQDDDAT